MGWNCTKLKGVIFIVPAMLHVHNWIAFTDLKETDMRQFLEVFDIRWLRSLSFSTENWHSTYLWPGNVYTNFDFSTFFWVTSMYGTDRQTDGWTRRIRWPIGQLHNNKAFQPSSIAISFPYNWLPHLVSHISGNSGCNYCDVHCITTAHRHSFFCLTGPLFCSHSLFCSPSKSGRTQK